MRGADVSEEDMSGAGAGGARARRRGARVDFLVGRGVVAALGFGGVVTWWEREWLGARVFWLGLAVGVLGASIAWVWRAGAGRRRRSVAVPVTVALAAAVVAATAWGRRPGASLLSDRIQGRDLAPTPVLALVPAFLLVAAGLLLAARRHPADGGDGTGWRASPESRLVAALTVAAVVVALLLGIGGLARAEADRWAESATTDRVAHRPADRVTAGPTGGPEEPGRRAWQQPIEHVGTLAGMAAVPGWDVVITSEEPATDEITSVVAARRATTGDLLWRYQRDGDVDQVTVDPEARRVLLVSANSLIVLDLVHGEELATRALPGDLWCGEPVDEDFARDVAEEVGVGPVAVSACHRSEDGSRRGQGTGSADDGLVRHDTTTAVIDVATGEVVRRLRPRAGHCEQPAAVTVSRTTYIAHWGETPCPEPRIVAVGAGGRVREVLDRIPRHPDALWGCNPASCRGSALRAGGGSLVLELAWEHVGDAPIEEVVVIDPDGEVRWRRDAASIASQGRRPYADVAGVTRHGIAVLTGTDWRLLDLTDGAVLAREPIADPNDSTCGATATDGVRLYSACGDGIHVRRADDLACLGVARIGDDGPGVNGPHVTAGALLFEVWDPGPVIVAHVDPGAG